MASAYGQTLHVCPAMPPGKAKFLWPSGGLAISTLTDPQYPLSQVLQGLIVYMVGDGDLGFVWDDLLNARADDMEFIILSKQLVFEVVKLMGESKERLEGRSEVSRDVSEKLNLSLYLLLRLEAVRLGKLEPRDLHDTITLAAQHTKPVIREDLVGTVYDVLGYVEI